MRILKFAGIASVGILIALGLTAYLLLPGEVPIEKIDSSVVRTPNLIEHAPGICPWQRLSVNT
jgi:hypothetical protein